MIFGHFTYTSLHLDILHIRLHLDILSVGHIKPWTLIALDIYSLGHFTPRSKNLSDDFLEEATLHASLLFLEFWPMNDVDNRSEYFGIFPNKRYGMGSNV